MGKIPLNGFWSEVFASVINVILSLYDLVILTINYQFVVFKSNLCKPLLL